MAKDPEPAESVDEDASTEEVDGPTEGANDAASPEEGSSDDRLAQLQAAFDRGDYAEVRSLAEPLIAEGGPLAESASDLVQRTRVDPAQIGVLIGCLLFFCFIVWRYVL